MLSYSFLVHSFFSLSLSPSNAFSFTYILYFPFLCFLPSLSQCDLVVEAVFEDLKIKQNVFQQLDKVCKWNCILASNTSSLDLDLIVEKTQLKR